MKPYQPRTYRALSSRKGLISFEVKVRETDLAIQADADLSKKALDLVLKCRSRLENYIEANPEYATTLAPWIVEGPAPSIIRDMARAGEAAGVGPMAAVAGAVAEFTGRGLLDYSDQVIVENGGDVFLMVEGEALLGIYAGESSPGNQVGVRVNCAGEPLGICTSSSSIGHSLSFGKADAVVVISRSCALADAVATSAANKVQSPKDVAAAVNFAKEIQGVIGVAAIAGDRLAAWGGLELAPVP